MSSTTTMFWRPSKELFLRTTQTSRATGAHKPFPHKKVLLTDRVFDQLAVSNDEFPYQLISQLFFLSL